MKKPASIALGILFLIVFSTILTQCKSKKNSQTSVQESNETVEEEVVVNSIMVKEGMDMRSIKSDPFKVDTAWVTNNQLHVKVQYGGGCEEHQFRLYTDKFYLKSLPMRLKVFLQHQANNDACRSIVSNELVYDIKEIQSPEVQHLQLRLNNYNNQIDYKY